MAKKAEVESRIAVSPIPHVAPGYYTNEKPLEAGVRSAFGGSLISQAIVSASETVPVGFVVFSSYTVFPRPSDSNQKTVYHVERIADGRAYATRVVRVTQQARNHNQCVLVSTISFQNTNIPPGNVLLNYSSPMLQLGVKPEDISPQKGFEHAKKYINDSMSVFHRRVEQSPFDWRDLDYDFAEDPTRFTMRGFFRTPPLSSDSHSTHLAAIAYASDENSMAAALFANLNQTGNKIENLALMASLTHNLSLRDTNARDDEWMVFERSTSWGAEGW
ncbi:Thioesterase/thiol ester dehydrase-isomerase [Hypoxylon trugodes]|uniref:Thioesterase/thiol ester dehydrase-isomerase n=1 Tax=Hypoxylon trugodes TaxID=326681 RepID=UPI00219F476C|nr:Thioesterase/thiol ester dehydrase-isomerase [Hypoxylon trugodes]KAI1385829.1 Thioesterase/thiol ester dehydrase-isomerase [Hypoxylon trugodes]